MVSPATKNDWWLNDGAARYSEALYVEHVAGIAGFQEVTKDMSVGALAYVSVPLADVGKLDAFSPEFQSLVTDKGGMILQMLRWVIGDEAFDKTMRTFVTQYAGKSATVDDFRKVAEQASGQQLSWFFTQWLNSTGAPEFKNKYTVYRTQKGFRVVGEISQDMDLFRMPIELRVDTDGKTETKRVEVEGTNSAYAIETFGKPRRISIDPNNDVLQNSTDLQVRTSIMRGQQDIEQGDLTEALKEFQKALDINKNSSLAHYRIAEVFFLQHNYQSAANAYREVAQRRRRASLDRGLEPHSTGHDLRPDGTARARHQRISPGAANQRQHPECVGHGTQVSAESIPAARAATSRDVSRLNSASQFQAAQPRGFFLCHIVGHQQHLKSFSHARGTDQVLELQSDFGVLLRQPAILEGVGKLRLFADAEEKLRLREERQRRQVRDRCPGLAMR